MKLAAGLLFFSAAFLVVVAVFGVGALQPAGLTVGLCVVGFVLGELASSLVRSNHRLSVVGESVAAGLVRMAALLGGVAAWLAFGAEFTLPAAIWLVSLYCGLLLLDVALRVGRLAGTADPLAKHGAVSRPSADRAF